MLENDLKSGYLITTTSHQPFEENHMKSMLLASIVLLLTNQVSAQVSSIDVTTKVVTVESRGIEVVYQTNLGEKSTVLDVSRNASITIGEKVASLEDLKPGFKATLEYHKELGVVTKIAAEEVSFEQSWLSQLTALQGEWKCIGSEENGKSRASAVEGEKRRLIIERTNLTMETGGGAGMWEGKFDIDSATGHFDWIGKSGENFVEWIGIYELDGDTLKLSFIFQRNDQAKRPKEFKSFPPQKPGLAHAFYTFKRVEEEKEEE